MLQAARGAQPQKVGAGRVFRGLIVMGREIALLLLPEVSTENYFEICLEYSIPNKVCPHNKLSYESLPCGVFIGAPTPDLKGTQPPPAILSHLMGKERNETRSRTSGERGWP